MFSFCQKKGVQLQDCKLTEDSAVVDAGVPDELILYMNQHIGKPSSPIVKVGDQIKRFQKIGQAEAFVSSPIHSPIDGTVKKIVDYPHPSGFDCKAVIIQPSEKNEPNTEKETKSRIPENKEEIIEKIQDLGIVGLGGAMFPSHVKFTIPKDKKADTLIINASECEPYITADSRLITEKCDDIVHGIKIIKKIIDPKKIIVGIEENKKSAIAKLKNQKGFELKILQSRYPQGAEKVLIKNLTGRDVPSKKLPLDVGVVVTNVATVFAVFEAVIKNKPLVERIVTVSGDVKNPKNFLVRLGTPYSYLIKKAGGFKGSPKKIFCGGPMMGITQKSFDSATIKGNNGIIVFNNKNKEISKHYEQSCIRCGKCVEVCPANLSPTTIVKYTKKEKYGFAKLNHAMECFECGSCSYVCPSKIDLKHWITIAKNEIKK